jgi:hypothetical protein
VRRIQKAHCGVKKEEGRQTKSSRKSKEGRRRKREFRGDQRKRKMESPEGEELPVSSTDGKFLFSDIYNYLRHSRYLKDYRRQIRMH